MEYISDFESITVMEILHVVEEQLILHQYSSHFIRTNLYGKKSINKIDKGIDPLKTIKKTTKNR